MDIVCSGHCPLLMVYRGMHVSFPECICTALEAEIVLFRFNVCRLDGGLLGRDGEAIVFRAVPSCEFQSNGLLNLS